MAQIPVKQVSVQDSLCEALQSECKALFEAVKSRAYELFDHNGKNPGREVQDWLEAERELLAPIQVSVKTETDKQLLTIAVPGFARKDIEVYTLGRSLVVKATTTEKTTTDGASSETSRNLLYEYPLGLQANIAGIEANLADGKLSISVPAGVNDSKETTPRAAVAA
jgi:HSP20 family molecular chaperone IbpA